MSKKTKEDKLLQAANLSPVDIDWVDKIENVHPMRQVFWASIIQVCVLGFMLGTMAIINIFV